MVVFSTASGRQRELPMMWPVQTMHQLGVGPHAGLHQLGWGCSGPLTISAATVLCTAVCRAFRFAFLSAGGRGLFLLRLDFSPVNIPGVYCEAGRGRGSIPSKC